MSCYHPILGLPDYEAGINENGKRTYKLYGRYDPDVKALDPLAVSIPCGHCIGCRLDYSRAWADRMMLELEHTGKAIFVTLTYDNEHVPFTECEETGEFAGLTLDKRDLQLFFKRLRKRFSDKEIRFYAAGEYGSTTYRPHYHAIIFGLCLEDFCDRKVRGKNELGQLHYQSEYLQEIWQNGFALLADVSWETCAYVSRYVQKKVFQGQNYLTDITGAEPEFSLMSRRPGIGAFYLSDHPELFDQSQIFVKGRPDGMRIPKYFLKKLELTDPVKYSIISEERKKYVDDRIFLKMQQTDLSYIEQLEVEENNKLLKTKALKRVL